MAKRAGQAGGRRGAASLRGALLLLVAVAFLAAILPAGVALDRWLVRELAQRAQRDLIMAPRLVAARDTALHDAMMMHAKELAQHGSLPAALRAAGGEQAIAIVEPVARSYHYSGVVIGANDAVWLGPSGSQLLSAETRSGGMPVRVVADRSGLHLVAVAPVMAAGEWLGAVGVSRALDAAAAGALAGLTHSDLVLLLSDAAQVIASGDSTQAHALAAAWSAGAGEGIRELRLGNARFLASAAPLNGATVVFVRDLRRELAMVPMLRRVVLVTGALALALALLLGWVLAGRLTRPVSALAAAADRLSAGDFDAPLPHASIREVARVTQAFADMRRALATRLHELRTANRLLEDRQARLSALQSELIKRERVSTSARMATELAHEIRNPVANIRNCLELLERRLGNDPEGREFAALAIDELLRMHELAERMLQLNRPRDADIGSSDVVAVAKDVIALTDLGNAGAAISWTLVSAGPSYVALPADALKQVLLNLVQNARDAMPNGLALTIDVEQCTGQVRIRVCDNGPGIPGELHERVFDPFFTTRAGAGGIGLGLFLVEGIVRGHGGTVSLHPCTDDTGTCFELVVPAAEEPVRMMERSTRQGASL